MLQRLRLASGAVEREHRLPLQPLPQRVFRGKAKGLGERVRVTTELDQRVEPLLEGDQPQLLESLDLGLEEVEVCQIGVGPAAPEPRCLRGERERKRGVPVTACRGALLHKSLERHRVHELGRRLERIAPAAGHDPSLRRE